MLPPGARPDDQRSRAVASLRREVVLLEGRARQLGAVAAAEQAQDLVGIDEAAPLRLDHLAVVARRRDHRGACRGVRALTSRCCPVTLVITSSTSRRRRGGLLGIEQRQADEHPLEAEAVRRRREPGGDRVHGRRVDRDRGPHDHHQAVPLQPALRVARRERGAQRPRGFLEGALEGRALVGDGAAVARGARAHLGEDEHALVVGYGAAASVEAVDVVGCCEALEREVAQPVEADARRGGGVDAVQCIVVTVGAVLVVGHEGPVHVGAAARDPGDRERYGGGVGRAERRRDVCRALAGVVAERACDEQLQRVGARLRGRLARRRAQVERRPLDVVRWRGARRARWWRRRAVR